MTDAQVAVYLVGAGVVLLAAAWVLRDHDNDALVLAMPLALVLAAAWPVWVPGTAVFFAGLGGLRLLARRGGPR